MFNFPNYYAQSGGLIKSSYQLMLFEWTDISILLREISKVGIVVGLVSSASSVVFNFDPTHAINWTAISGCSWLLFRTCAKKLEPQAQHMLQSLREGND